MRHPPHLHRPRLAAHLLLALILVLAPLLGNALPAQPVEPPATGQMPCHGEPATLAEPGHTRADCPHCNDPDSPGPCQCCGAAAPAALPGVSFAPPVRIAGLTQSLDTHPSPLPDTPSGSLYRPPIFSA